MLTEISSAEIAEWYEFYRWEAEQQRAAEQRGQPGKGRGEVNRRGL